MEIINSVLENKKFTGPAILTLSIFVLFLIVWKSGVEPAPRHIGTRQGEKEVVSELPAKTKSRVSGGAAEDRDSYLQNKRVYSFSHLTETYRRTCMMQANPTSSCTRLACDDGKVYCVASYLEISQ